MFYICKKREDGRFGVMDNQDGIVEYYQPAEIIKFVKKLHVDIKGVYRKENGNWGINILKPASFIEVDSNIDIIDDYTNSSQSRQSSLFMFDDSYEPVKLLEELSSILLSKRIPTWKFTSFLHEYIYSNVTKTDYNFNSGTPIRYSDLDNDSVVVYFSVYPDCGGCYLTIFYSPLQNKYWIPVYEPCDLNLYVSNFKLKDLIDVKLSYSELKDRLLALDTIELKL